MPRVRKENRGIEVVKKEKEIIKQMIMYARSHTKNGQFDLTDSENKKNIGNLLYQIFRMEAFERKKIPILASEFIESYDSNKLYFVFINEGKCCARARINNDNGNFRESARTVFFNLNQKKETNPDLCIINLLVILFHELDHCREYDMAHTDASNLELLMNSESSAFSDLAKLYGYSYTSSESDQKTIDEIRKFYFSNHDKFLYENQANINGIEKTQELIDGEIMLDTQATAWLQSYLDSNKSYRADAAFHEDVSLKLDRIAKPEHIRFLIAKYPILRKEYNPDGAKKSAYQMVKEQEEEMKSIEERKNKGQINIDEYSKLSNDCKNMYSYLIGKEIFKIIKSYEKNKTIGIEDATMLKMISEVNPNIFNDINLFYSNERNHAMQDCRSDNKESIVGYYKERIDAVKTAQEMVQDYTQKTEQLKNPQKRITLLEIREAIIARGKQFNEGDYDEMVRKDAEGIK